MSSVLYTQEILDIIERGEREEILALFQFSGIEDNQETIRVKFNMWVRYFLPQYFKYDDAPFHVEWDTYNIEAYKGLIRSYTNIASRGLAKTTRTKLFLAFAILNDVDHYRRYIKILSKDYANARQSATDIYNILVSSDIRAYYPNTFSEKGDAKHQQTMGEFDCDFGEKNMIVKIKAGTVGVDQRGGLQNDSRPDLIWFDDFETSESVTSAVVTNKIFMKMEEARNGLSIDGTGSCIYTCNYITERGNVHRLVEKKNDVNIVTITPIEDSDGNPTWFHTKEYLAGLRETTDDYEGEYLCMPSASHDVIFERSVIDTMPIAKPERVVAGLKMFSSYNPSHQYVSGQDVGGGVGLDSSANVIIDLSTIPAKVCATYKSNSIKPDDFGDEIKRHNEYYNYCFVGTEKNNHGHATIGRLKQIYPRKKLLETPGKEITNKHDRELMSREYGWHTNTHTKPKMFNELAKAVNDGHLLLQDEDLIREARSYTRNDLMDNEIDPRLATRHFDMLTACAIAWQMRHYATPAETEKQRMQEYAYYVDNQNFDPFAVL